MPDYQQLQPQVCGPANLTPALEPGAALCSPDMPDWQVSLDEAMGNQAVADALCGLEEEVQACVADPWSGWWSAEEPEVAEAVCEDPAAVDALVCEDPEAAQELVSTSPEAAETLVCEAPETAQEVFFPECSTDVVDASLDEVCEGETSEESPEQPAKEEETGPDAACGPKDFTGRAECLFSTIDQDGDGYLSSEDIDHAMARNDLDPESAATVAMLRRYRENLEELSNDENFDEDDGVTLADLQKYREALAEIRANGGEMPEELGGLETFYTDAIAKINNTEQRLFTDEGPRVDAIRQGHAGTCSLISTLGSMISQGRGAELEQMMHDNEDGTYTVTFPGRDPITVNRPTSAEIAFGASSGSNGMWLIVMEKAYGQLRDEDDDTEVDFDAAEGSREEAIETLTGHEVDGDETEWTDEDTTHEKLQEHLTNGDIVTIGQAGSNDAGIVKSHAYTVVRYDPATRMVTLRNPWGHNPGSANAEITVPLSTLDNEFGDITYEER